MRTTMTTVTESGPGGTTTVTTATTTTDLAAPCGSGRALGEHGGALLGGAGAGGADPLPARGGRPWANIGMNLVVILGKQLVIIMIGNLVISG